MKALELLAQVSGHLGQAPSDPGPDGLAHFEDGSTTWAVALCPQQAAPSDYLRAFEAAMQAMIATRQQGFPGTLALALDFGPVRRGERPSYRQALKKYSNSIVFEDVSISLLLVEEGRVELVPPAEVNDYLSRLDERMRLD